MASYAIAFGFFKFTNYALFFWLPFFLTSHFSPSESNLISTLYDIGMMPGRVSFLAGFYARKGSCGSRTNRCIFFLQDTFTCCVP